MTSNFSVVLYDDARHREQVIDLWETVFGYESAHNTPALVIDKKKSVSDGLFFVAEGDGVIGTVICGYDGHRGWIYSLAVTPSHQRGGVGRYLIGHAEKELSARGCVKINIQLLEHNKEVEAFYHKLGYQTEPRISMGKKLAENVNA